MAKKTATVADTVEVVFFNPNLQEAATKWQQNTTEHTEMTKTQPFQNGPIDPLPLESLYTVTIKPC